MEPSDKASNSLADTPIPKPPHRQVATFVDRYNEEGLELAEHIRSRLRQNRLVTIWGAGGVGKSVLAIEVANSLSYPNGVIWINAEVQVPLTQATLQDEICAQLGARRDARPFLEDRRLSVARMLLGQASCLVAIDHFELIPETEQGNILSFLDDAPCPVLLTSRKRLERGENVHLGPMKLPEAQQYMRDLVKESSEPSRLRDINLERVAQIAHYNPLAMRWMTRQLELGIDIETVARDLERGSGEPAARIFGRSFDRLGETSREVLWALCLFATTALREALSCACELTPEKLNDVLDELVKRDLVFMDGTRVGALGLTRRLARVPQERSTVFYKRLLNYYLKVASGVDYFWDPSVLDAEYQNLMGIMTWFFHEEMWREALSLFDAVGEFLTDRSGYEDRLRLANLVLTAAQSIEDTRAFAWHQVYTFAWIYLREDYIGDARPLVDDSLRLGQEGGYQDVVALSFRSLALIAQKEGDLKEAERLMTESLSIWEGLGDRRWIAMSKTYLGGIAFANHDLTRSLALLVEARRMFSDLKNVEGLGWAAHLLGQVELASGHIEEARRQFADSLQQREIMRAPAGIAHTAMSLAGLEIKAGNFDVALGYAERAYQIYSQLGELPWKHSAEEMIRQIQDRRDQSRTMTRKLAVMGGPKAVTSFYRYKWPVITGEMEEAVCRQLHRAISIYGREGIYEELEDKFAKYHGMKYAISTNSGTSALHSAFFGVGIGPGDEVLCPTYTFLATVTPILQSNGCPILCDAEPETGNIDPADIRRKLTNRSKAIVVTHMWGHPCEMDEILSIARERNLYLIEDCSHAHGATYNGKKVGTFGDVGIWSLQAKKIVFAGEGGMLLTNDRSIYERATLLGHFRARSEQTVVSEHYSRYVKTGFGLNYRMSPLNAAIASVAFDHLDRWIESRGKNLDYLTTLLKEVPGIKPPSTRRNVTRGAYYGYKPLYQPEALEGVPIQVYLEALQAEGMDVKKPGSMPLHLLPLFQGTDDKMYSYGCPRRCPHAEERVHYKAGDLPNSEDYYARALSLPTFTEDSPEVTRTIEQYAEAFRKVGENLQELKEYARVIATRSRQQCVES